MTPEIQRLIEAGDALEKQAYHHDPENGIFGDCYRTCLAGMVGMRRDEVPHYVTTMNPSEWETEVQPKYDDWLSSLGLMELAIPMHGEGVTIQEILNFHSKRTPYKTTAMLTGESRTGVNHVVLISGGEIIHDPSINNSGIIGPCGDGFYWITWLIPMQAARAAVEDGK